MAEELTFRQRWKQKLDSRKLMICLILLGLSSLFLAVGLIDDWTSLIDGAQWIDFNKWNFLIYVGGNVGDKLVNGRNENK